MPSQQNYPHNSDNSDGWQTICKLSDLIPDSGVCALLASEQVAIFYLPAVEPPLYAIGNWDPIGKASVLSRGIIGDTDGMPVVASPLYKQHYSLISGQCIEDEKVYVPVYPVALINGEIQIRTPD